MTGFFEQGQTVATDPLAIQVDAVGIDVKGIAATITDPQTIASVEKPSQQWIRVDGNTRN